MSPVRRGRPDDLAILTDIQSVLTEPSPRLLSGALTDDGPLTVFVATSPDTADAPVGYAILVPGPDVAYIPELAVALDAQRQGHGSALLARVFAETDASEVRLTVAVTNERARQFYRHHGFVEHRRLSDQFESGDGLLLVRPV